MAFSARPVVKIRPLATEMEEYACPIPVAFQTSGGPPAGQSFKSPFSVEMSSTFGPRQRGQSPSALVAPGSKLAIAETPAAAERARSLRRDGGRDEEVEDAVRVMPSPMVGEQLSTEG